MSSVSTPEDSEPRKEEHSGRKLFLLFVGKNNNHNNNKKIKGKHFGRNNKVLLFLRKENNLKVASRLREQ